MAGDSGGGGISLVGVAIGAGVVLLIMAAMNGCQQSRRYSPAYSGGGGFSAPIIQRPSSIQSIVREHPFSGVEQSRQYRCDESGAPANPGTGWCYDD